MDYWTAYILGLAGSFHCAGMCGPLALALPVVGTTLSSQALGRLVYNLGRVVTYCLIGLVFGLCGKTLTLAGLQRWLCLILGCLLLAGLLGTRRLALWAPMVSLFNGLKAGMGAMLRRRSMISLVGLGLLNGFLPCGLVYVAAAGAMATADLRAGVQYMAVFGLGTVPMMLAISLSGNLMPNGWRLRLRKSVPVAVALLAGLLIFRGLSLGIPYLSPDLSSGRSGAFCCH